MRAETSGSVEYIAADLNYLDLPADTYDLVAVKGTLHHLMRLDHVIAEIHKTLKPGGLLWVSDSDGDEALTTVLAASAFMFVLPTQVSYGEKLRGLLRFGLRSPSRVKASMEAEGSSPFEGAGREHDWLKLIRERFTVEALARAPGFHRLPDRAGQAAGCAGAAAAAHHARRRSPAGACASAPQQRRRPLRAQSQT